MGVHHLHKLDIRAFWKSRIVFYQRTPTPSQDFVDGDGREEDAVGVAHVHLGGQAEGGQQIRWQACWPWRGGRPPQFHADGRVYRVAIVNPNGAPAAVQGRHPFPLQRHVARIHQITGKDAQPVAAHLRLGAVRVPDDTGKMAGRGRVGQGAVDDAVAAHAPVSITNGDGLGRCQPISQGRRLLGRVKDQIIVAQRMVFVKSCRDRVLNYHSLFAFVRPTILRHNEPN